MTPYRVADLEAKGPPPPSWFAYRPSTTERRGMPMAILQLIAVPALAATATAWLVGPNAALVALVVSAVGLGLWWKRGPMAADARTLFVEDGILVVRGPRGHELRKMELGDLLQVELDTKTVEMVQEGGSAIPAVRMLESRVGPKLDRSRIVLALADGSVLRLGDEYQSHTTALEWVGKMRVFLRKHGWVPNDERPSDSLAPDSLAPDSFAPDSFAPPSKNV